MINVFFSVSSIPCVIKYHLQPYMNLIFNFLQRKQDYVLQTQCNLRFRQIVCQFNPIQKQPSELFYKKSCS